MSNKHTYNDSQLRDMASIFSRNQVLEWQKGDFSSLNAKIARYFPNWVNSRSKTYFDFLRQTYQIIAKGYPNEYIYKNTLLTNWLIEDLGRDDSKLYSEFRVGGAVADLVIFNGTSKAFEIKTKFDSDARLPHQLENYRKAFNYIYLVVPEENRMLYLQQDKQIGIITYQKSKEQSFKKLRVAQQQTSLDPNSIMEILHTHEYKGIVKQYFGELPKMNSFTQYECCKAKFRDIPIYELNRLFLAALKSRKQYNVFSSRYYPELNQISLSMNFSSLQRKKLISRLNSPIRA